MNYSTAPATGQYLNRYRQGEQIAHAGGVKQIEDPQFGVRAFSVISQSNPAIAYQVQIPVQGRATCDCPDSHPVCKHIHAVKHHEQAELDAGWEDFQMTDAVRAEDFRFAAELVNFIAHTSAETRRVLR